MHENIDIKHKMLKMILIQIFCLMLFACFI